MVNTKREFKIKILIFPFLVLMKGLTSYFKNVKVEVVDCPNLKREPFTLASPGERNNISIHLNNFRS